MSNCLHEVGLWLFILTVRVALLGFDKVFDIVARDFVSYDETGSLLNYLEADIILFIGNSRQDIKVFSLKKISKKHGAAVDNRIRVVVCF